MSPRVGGAWAPNETVNFYVKYSEGYNAGGHYYDQCNNGYQPETISTVEGTGKRKMVLTGDWLLIFPVTTTTLRTSSSLKRSRPPRSVVNVPGAKMYGGEFQVTALPIENFTVNLNVSLMHSEYENFFEVDETNTAAGVQKSIRTPNRTGTKQHRASRLRIQLAGSLGSRF